MKSRDSRLVVTLFLASMLLLHLLLAWNSRERLRQGYQDFTIFYSAAEIVRQGLATQLYDEPTQFRIQQEFASEVSIRQGSLPYNHPPFEALLFVPFTWLPYFTAFLLWDFLNLLILFAVPLLLRRHVPLLQQAPTAFWFFTALAFFPVFITLLQGQDSVLLLLLFTLALVSLKTKADFAAGCWLGLGLFRFHLVLPLMLILVVNKRRKALLGFLLVALALGAISIAVVGWRQALSYPAYLWHVENTMGGGATMVSSMPDLRGFVESIGAARISKHVLDAVVAILSLALVGLASVKWKCANLGRTFDLGFSLAIVVTVLVSYHTLAHDLSLLFLPVLLLANHFRTAEVARGWTRLALLGPMLVLFLSPIQMVLWFRYGQYSLLAPVLLLWLFGITREISRQALRSPRNSTVLEST